MKKRRKVKKPTTPKLKRAIPIVATNPAKGVVSIIPVTEEKLKERSWYERLFG